MRANVGKGGMIWNQKCIRELWEYFSWHSSSLQREEAKSRVDSLLMRGRVGSFWASWLAGMYLRSCKPSRLLIGNPSGHGVGSVGGR